MEFKGPKKEKIEEQARKFCFCIRLVKDLSTQAASTQKFQSPVIISILLSDANPKKTKKEHPYKITGMCEMPCRISISEAKFSRIPMATKISPENHIHKCSLKEEMKSLTAY